MNLFSLDLLETAIRISDVSVTSRSSAFHAVGCCIVAFFCGLLFVQRSGNYFVTMFDDYSAGLPLTVVVILENLSVAWIYGTKR